jgi:hypothetical protein
MQTNTSRNYILKILQRLEVLLVFALYINVLLHGCLNKMQRLEVLDLKNREHATVALILLYYVSTAVRLQ